MITLAVGLYAGHATQSHALTARVSVAWTISRPHIDYCSISVKLSHCKLIPRTPCKAIIHRSAKAMLSPAHLL